MLFFTITSVLHHCICYYFIKVPQTDVRNCSLRPYGQFHYFAVVMRQNSSSRLLFIVSGSLKKPMTDEMDQNTEGSCETMGLCRPTQSFQNILTVEVNIKISAIM